MILALLYLSEKYTAAETPHATREIVIRPIASVFFLMNDSGSGIGLLPNPCILSFSETGASVLSCASNFVGSGRPLTRACSTCLYKAAANESYRCRILQVAKAMPCSSRNVRHCLLPPACMSSSCCSVHWSSVTERTKLICVPRPLQRNHAVSCMV